MGRHDFKRASARAEAERQRHEYITQAYANFARCYRTQALHGIIGSLDDGSVGIVDDATRRNACLLAMFQNGEYEGCGAACREAQHEILFSYMLVAELMPAILQVVFSRFPGLCKAADASGEDGLYLRTVDAIGVLHFDGIERSQSSPVPQPA